MANGTSDMKPILTSIVVRPPYLQKLSHSNIHVVDDATKAYLFRRDIPFTASKKARTRATLDKLKLLSPLTASQLALKIDDIRDLRFRLYGGYSVHPGEGSYIALSYRWSAYSRNYRKHPKQGSESPLPLSSAMFQAVLNERQSENEGLWIDQICINQDDDTEKATSVGAMDTIYKSARLVVIALDDLVITDDEARALKAYANTMILSEPLPRLDFMNRYLDDRMLFGRKIISEIFHGAIRKVLSSQYFERAWCHHEFRLGRDHVFLVPMLDLEYPDSGSYNFLRFNGPFLYYAVLLHANSSSSTAKLERMKRDLHSIFLKKSLAQDPVGRSFKNAVNHQFDAFHSYTHSIAEVFNSEAGGNPILPTKELRDRDANVDKMSIALNAVDSGLVLRQSSNQLQSDQTRTLQQCQLQMMLVALAAGDPVVLCTTGSPLRLEKDRSSWLCWPHSGDIDVGHFSPISALPADTPMRIDQSPACEFIELDLLFIHFIPSSSYNTYSTPSIYYRDAQIFLDQCIEQDIWGQSLYWLSWQKEADAERNSQRNLFTRTLAAIFSCGKQWIMQVSSHLSIDRTPLSQSLSYLFPDDLKQLRDNWWRTPDRQKSAKHILAFLRAVTGKNLELFPPNLQPRVFQAPTGEMCLAFVPSSESSLYLAIPAVLVGADYDFLSRCWVLSGEDDGDEPSEWSMQGKSRIFGVDSFSVQDTSQRSGFRPKQRVRGPRNGKVKRGC